MNVRLREEFHLYANVRPGPHDPARPRYEDIDIVLIRENLEGLYIAFEHYIPVGDDLHAVAISSGVNTRAGAEHIVRYAFEYTLKNNRKKVTVVHKANVLKALTGLFLDAGRKIAKDYEGVYAMDDRIVDGVRHAACPQSLAIRCHRHDQSVR